MNPVFNKNKNKFPSHEFSHLINANMSFDNTYIPDEPSEKNDLVTKLKNIRCDGGISLEPRLQEYMKKKKYYKDNNIKPCVSLEREFQITKEDVKRMKRFLNDKKDFYLPENNKLSHSIKHKKQTFPSSQFPEDSRVLKPKKPEKRNIPTNRGMFAPDHHDKSFYEDPLKQDNYLLNGDEMIKSNGFSLNETRFDPRTDPNIYAGHHEENPRKDSQYYVDWGQGKPIKENKRKMKNHKLKYKKRNIPNSTKGNHKYNGYEDVGGYDDWNKPSNNIDELYDQNQRYGKLEIPQTFRQKNEMDVKNKMVIPNIAHKANRNLDMADYNISPYLYGEDDVMDIEQETCLINGMPTRTSKSYGFRNPVEHQFQYVDDDFNNAEHSVMPFPRGGVSARLQNTKTARPFTDGRQFDTY
ncbi:MAG: hypothetical protein CMF62_00115 [Magnetococcales bacterium]|nr:hypothetical protein [Magnetococcales bacterium]|tara:strand:+ start:2199 stop:3431 length:1233 start_codon:yes stop_codon:yes gene_type:complete